MDEKIETSRDKRIKQLIDDLNTKIDDANFPKQEKESYSVIDPTFRAYPEINTPSYVR